MAIVTKITTTMHDSVDIIDGIFQSHPSDTHNHMLVKIKSSDLRVGHRYLQRVGMDFIDFKVTSINVHEE